MTEGFERTQTVAASNPQKTVTHGTPDYLGPYRVVEEIASGGMGTVYLAVRKLDDRVKKIVALKTIHPHLAKQPGFVQMFLDEASIAARISHPNAATIVDFGEADGRFYLAMEYLRGEPLDSVLEHVKARPELRRDPSYPALMAHIVAEAADGIHALHELRGPDGELLDAVHRDISPHNIFIGYDGRVTVLDFGVARSKDKVHQTETGEIRGKVAYISPEQMHGDAADRRSDIWSLGVVLWEALALRSLFRRPTPVDTILAVRSATIEPVSDHNPLVDPDLEQLLGAALSRSVGARPDTAEGFALALRRIARRGEGRSGLARLMTTLFPDGETQHHARLIRAQSTSIRPARLVRAGRARAIVGLSAAALVGALAVYFLVAPETTREAPAAARTQSVDVEPFAIEPLATRPIPDAAIQEAGSDSARDAKPEADERPRPAKAAVKRTRPSRRLRAYARKKPAGSGTLNLVTPGGWAVVLDQSGKRLGRTPLSTKLSVGQHRLTLVPFGDASKKRLLHIRISADHATKRAVTLAAP